MIEYKSELKKILLLENFDQLENQINSICKLINEKDLANFFIDVIYLKSIVQLTIDDHWIQSQKNPQQDVKFDRLIKKYLASELKPLLFLHSFFLDSSIEGMHVASKVLSVTEKLILACIKSKPAEFQKTILQVALQSMSELFELEHQLNSTPRKNEEDARLSLYRSFDILDQIFELDYLSNEVSTIDQKERLYMGAGIGVQSSYATTSLALRYLNLSKGSRFVDLGSGYGRIGSVVGLMRPDVIFTGYEFVKERVDIANKASTRFHLNQHVQFVAQDLSDPDFKIPLAETFYIFDSFTDETYATIIKQLQEMTAQKRITVVTKGNARLWMKSHHWSEPQELNEGNLCFFRSR